MNIKIVDSWLREYLKTKATATKIAEVLSLTSVSVERLEKINNDYVYDIEVTTNRPDVMSVIGLSREAAAALTQCGIDATLIPYTPKPQHEKVEHPETIFIKNNPTLVDRICAVVMEVEKKDSPPIIKTRLEESGIRSLNNLIDVTNYVMREIGHPTHVFDYDRLHNHTLLIRKSKKGEKIVTLDKKEHLLLGDDIVADNGTGEIIDLLGVMGTANSVVTDNTKRILFFIDSNKPNYIRKTSMHLSIRSEAAVLNEKGIDPTLAMTALLRGIELYKKTANGKIVSQIIDIYPNKVKPKTISISLEKIQKTLGVPITLPTVLTILKNVGFETSVKNTTISLLVPSWRANDVTIAEDICEEVARLYGYHQIPSLLPPLTKVEHYSIDKNSFYWEKRVKDALKYWGFTESYTYSLVSESLLDGPINEAVTLANPLSEDMMYLRKTLVPSLLQTIEENKTRETIKIFEIANVYKKTNDSSLPNEIPMLAGVIKKQNISFFEVKGIVEQLLRDVGIKNVEFKRKDAGGEKINILLGTKEIGEIEILDENIVDFELNFLEILLHANLKKVYNPLPKFPPIIEDVRITIGKEIPYADIVTLIKKESSLVVDVSLLDIFEDKKTFRITYQNPNQNLTDKDVTTERNRIHQALEKKLHAKIS